MTTQKNPELETPDKSVAEVLEDYTEDEFTDTFYDAFGKGAKSTPQTDVSAPPAK